MALLTSINRRSEDIGYGMSRAQVTPHFAPLMRATPLRGKREAAVAHARGR
jgi:hypothetical protein